LTTWVATSSPRARGVCPAVRPGDQGTLRAVQACSNCGGANPEGYRFCGHCGASLLDSGCRKCGAPSAEGQRFCGECGAALGDELVVPLAGLGDLSSIPERKLATVLFADVVGFTSLSERTDPELVARMVDSAFRELAAVVVEHGGTIDKYMGDSLMAVFGVPAAHDDDAERAVAAALAMRKLGGDLVFSIGINSGEVMVTAIGGEAGVTVIGDTVNVAARLEKAAGPGEVLCGPLTVDLVGGRGVFRPRQPVILKGKREPVDVAEAVSLRPSGSEATQDDLPLIGRDDEMAYLGALWQRVARDGQFQIVLLCGDAGSGKTRLAAELARLAGADGTVVRSGYPAYGSTGGVTVMADVLRQLGPADDDEVTLRVRSLAGKTDESLRAMDVVGLQKEQMWGFQRLLEEKGSEAPLLIVIDDIHRSSEIMLDVVSEMAGRLSAVPLLMLLVGRSEPGSWLAHFPSATTVRMAPLGRCDATALSRALVCDKPLADEAADFLVDRAGGNPLYLRELIRMARVSGSLVDDGECYRLGVAAAVPASLHAVLAARLDTLGLGQKAVFQHAALLGGSATEESVIGLGAPGGLGALASLVDGGLLRRTPEGVLEAADPLLSEVAYETLPRNLRGALHRQAASLASESEERARHIDRAAEYLTDDSTVALEASEVLATLGEEYVDLARYTEALRFLERAAALGSLRPSAALKLADLQGWAGDESGALATLGLIEDDAADPSIAIERDHAAARTKLFSDPEWARPRLQSVAERWRALGRTESEAWATGNCGVASFNLSRMEDAADELERALEMFLELGDRAGAVSCSSFLCLVKPADRRVEGWLADALAFADETGERVKQITALIPLVWNQFLRSLWGGPQDTMAAEGFARRLADVSGQMGSEETAMQAHSLLAIMARWSGRMDEAREQQIMLAPLVDGTGHRDRWLGWAAGFSVAVAGGAASAAPPFPPTDTADPVAGIAGLVIRAELAFAGRIDEATARFEAMSHSHGAVADAAGALDALTLVLAGRPEEARPWAERAASAARVLDAPPAELVAAALLAEIDRDFEALPALPVGEYCAADAIVLRARAVLGDEDALVQLREAAKVLAMPGLLSGV
jgi:class 3 adenylate cyclase/tetratricopeptide (TPR) repeat protein